MGFNSTFYAGRPKLSEVTIDSDLDMGGRTIRAGRIDSPYIPETIPTEPLDWGDVPPAVVATIDTPNTSSSNVEYSVYTPTKPVKARLSITLTGGDYLKASEVRIGGVTVANIPKIEDASPEESPVFVTVPGTPVVFWGGGGNVGGSTATVEVIELGTWHGGKTFDLSGKWLALGLDMEGLAATIKIQGVEIPYSDYAMYFPIAPSELTIAGDWDISQVRPVITAYK